MIESNLPLVTFALFAYNQENFIREAVDGALAQDYSNLEIIISDDFSSDKTFEIIENIVRDYQGPHTIRLNKNKINLGLVKHINRMFEMASGELIVAAAGDDISVSTRVTCLVEVFCKSKPMLIHSSVTKIDVKGNDFGVSIPPLILKKMSISEVAGALALYIGATGAWNKSLYTKFGPIIYFKAYEDLVFGFRAALSNSIVYIDSPLVKYRVGSGITTKKSDLQMGVGNVLFNRCRAFSVFIDVYSQRLDDLNVVKECKNYGFIKSILNKQLKLQHINLAFYKSPVSFVKAIFSMDCLWVLNVFVREFLFVVLTMGRVFRHLADKLFND